jgi:hypothetical protein
MAEFLTAEWLQELDIAARASAGLAELGRQSPFVVEQHVHDAPRGDVTYHVIIDEHGARVHSGSATTPDVVLSTDFATASAMHRGDTNAQQALIAGKLKVGGTVDRLARRREAFEALADVFASVRTTTTGAD